MGFKKLLLGIAVASSSVLWAESSFASGIPVYCLNCQDASYNAAHAILDGQRSQTEALLNAFDYMMRAQQKLDTTRAVAEGSTQQKIANSYAMEPSLGAKPRVACAQYGAATMRAMSAGSASKLRTALTQRTRAHNNQGRALAQGEPRKDYSNNQIINLLDDPNNPVSSGAAVMENEPVSADDLSALEKSRQTFELILNPYPVEMPSEDDVKRIKANGTAREKEDLARTIALQKRQEVGQYIQDQEYEKNIRRLDPSAVQYLIDDIGKFLTDDQLKMLKGKISPNQLNELMATYRVRSDEWVKTATTSPSPMMAAREQMLIGAEMLNQLYMLNDTNTKILKMLAFSDIRNVSKDGMISK